MNPACIVLCLNPLKYRGNYSATSKSMKLVHWPLMSGLLHLVERGEDWAVPHPAQAPPRCTKCNSPPINGQCTNHRIVRCFAVLMCPLRVNIVEACSVGSRGLVVSRRTCLCPAEQNHAIYQFVAHATNSPSAVKMKLPTYIQHTCCLQLSLAFNNHKTLQSNQLVAIVVLKEIGRWNKIC